MAAGTGYRTWPGPCGNMSGVSRQFDEERRRRWFSDLLWRAFPGSSVAAKARAAAPALGMSERQVRALMMGEHDAKLGTVLAVLAIAGAESILEIMDPEGAE